MSFHKIKLNDTMKGCTYASRMNTVTGNFIFKAALVTAMVFAHNVAMATIIISSGPSVRIPGITTPTVLQLTGADATRPQRWTRAGGGSASNVVTVPDTYFAQVNLSTNPDFPFWANAGSITIPALTHNLALSGPSPLNPGTTTTLCLQSNGAAYVTNRDWYFNGRNQFNGSGESACQTIFQPGAYYMQVTYQYGIQSVTLSVATVNIIAPAHAPAVNLNKSTIDPVSSPPTCTIANFSAFVSISRFKNGSFDGMITSAASPITAAGYYFLLGTLPGGAGAFSYEFTVTKGSIPAPAIAAATELTYADPEIMLSASPNNYNAGYSWYYNNLLLPGETTPQLLITRPGAYTVRGCAMHADGQTECKISAVLAVTGEVMKVNSITKRTTRVEGIFTAQQVNNAPKEQVSQSAEYADGFARTLQTIGRESSPAGKDVVLINAYDAQGREQQKFLPYVSLNTDGNYRYVSPSSPAALNAFYQASGDYIANTLAPHAVTVFEPSPLNRVKAQGAAGEAWQPATGGHPVHYNEAVYRQANSASDVLRWKENAQGELVAAGKYVTESLLVTEVTDENGSLTREFTDKSGRKILRETPGEGTERLRTYYVYDDLGKLKYMLPPRVAGMVSTLPFTLTATIIRNECFRYQYDGRGLLVLQQVPGAGPRVYAYDAWDRQVLAQTALQREGQRWTFTKYDALDRPVMEGEVTLAGSQADVQQQVNNFYASIAGNALLRYEESGSTLLGYTNRSYPVLSGETQVNTVTYYDHYAFLLATDTTYAFKPQPDLSLTGAFQRVKGLLTGTLNRMLGSSQFLLTVSYYDAQYRLIQGVAGHHLGGTDRVSSQYNFEGKPLKKKRVHLGNLAAPVVTLEEYTYDVAGRLMEVHHRVNGEPPVLLLQNQYNEIGQLIEKSFHEQNGSFWQKRDYEYNIRGWLTKVNGGAETESLFNDMYGFELAYNQTLAGMGNSPQYNGNITAYTETRPFELENAQPLKSGYAYTYDAADRLKHAAYMQVSNPAMNGAYNEGQLYDANGNITALTRKGVVEASQQVIDQLAYTYTGNQLQKVDDTANAQAGFRDIGGVTDYAYDANGNLTRDANKNITHIQYNILDLPDSITFSDGHTLAITYSAAGEKLGQVVYHADQSVKEKYDYVKGFLYRNDSLKMLQHDEGRVVYAGGPWVYEYYLKDHLGNVRCTFTTGVEDETFTATLEENTAKEETAMFGESYARAVIVNAEVFNHTAKGARSLRLNGATEKEITGMAKSVQVLEGDRVTLEVYAKYVASRGKETNASQLMMAVLSSAFGLSPGAPGEAGLAYESLAALDRAGLLIHTGKGVNDLAPKAYLNYILFDKEFIPYDLGFEQLDATAREDGSGVEHDHLQLDVNVTRPGYLYVYLSNESATVTDVYFDDLAIIHTPSPIISTTTYYPYGMMATQYTREGATVQRLKYNGKELLDEEGLDWHDFGARMYDAALGRWHVIDPLADKYAAYGPYHYALDNPVKFVDPDGKDAELVIDDENKTATLQANYYVYGHDMNLALDAMSVWTSMSGKHKIKVGNEEYTLNFAMQVIEVSGETLERAAQADPIGNTIASTSKTVTNAQGYVLAGKTLGSRNITMQQSSSALELAHEMGHTLLGLGGDSEHISKTIMNDGDSDLKKKINKDFVKKVRQTYGLEKNPRPTEPFTSTTIKKTGEEVTNFHGENFRLRRLPKISNEELRRYFQRFIYDPRQ